MSPMKYFSENCIERAKSSIINFPGRGCDLRVPRIMRRNRTKSFCEIAAERGLLERLVNLDSLEQIFLELRQLARAKCR